MYSLRAMCCFSFNRLRQPDYRSRSEFKHTNHTVSILEGMASLYWIVLLRFVGAYCLFFDGERRHYVDRGREIQPS